MDIKENWGYDSGEDVRVVGEFVRLKVMEKWD